MYNFEQHLLKNEKILYQGRSVPGKGGKNIGGLLFLVLFSLVVLILLMWKFFETRGAEWNISLGILIILVFLGLGLYGLIYNVFLKRKRVADDFYCLTNQRVLKYESKKTKLVYGNLSTYEDIQCLNMKDNFGDVYFGIVLDEGNNDAQTLATLKELMVNPDPVNMPFIYFESIENPTQVMKLAEEARNKLL